MKRKRVLVVGHRSPDSDSVCAAIGYAYFKNILDDTQVYVPCAAGSLNPETEYILERFGLEPPVQVASVAATVADMDLNRPISISPRDSILDAANLIKEKRIRSLPVVDEDGRLLGIVDTLHLAVFFAERLDIEGLSVSPVQLHLLISALQGKVLANTGRVTTLGGDVFVAASQKVSTLNRMKKGDIAILGDRTDIQKDLIKGGCAALIVTGDHAVSEEVLELARRHQVLVISSPYRTFATAQLVNLCRPVSYIMSSNVPVAGLHTTISEVKRQIVESDCRCAMVVDEDDRLIGIITRSDLLDPVQKQVILVDHNEISQAVADIEQADILEIIDHHRLGDISTIKPITVYNEPVGSTCTIVAMQLCLHQVEVPPEIAGALLSGILSDTLLLTLSTTTDKDHVMAHRLSEMAGLNLADYGKELLAVSVTAEGIPAQEIVTLDFKEYHLAGKKIGVNQIMVLDDSEIKSREAEIKGEMEKLCLAGGYDLLALLITNPLSGKGEEIWVEGAEQEIVGRAFGVKVEDGKCFVPRVLSRKKDFIPRIATALRER
ncbi:putative manganese-dependent inorganic diphosphatase [Candidatus Desulforudis audaxviator]|uniref:inorganic diphosphatase n=1 Tax=Desulforudis audaxviator (strain MP104C) TaxID=477974 RepID=B1I1D4_DESAP|nr:putative manganese-dependent inorganic diphosphatase [Candidatus Desulforudis audaxviator]ACA58906.1 Inorganic diphosphatase [Candidatus Desulforudis audaxviator MP104C]AZK58925.1 Manganese-dependent inorganic pyrophosphatase [Candidatus Desulforudis audaxviator]